MSYSSTNSGKTSTILNGTYRSYLPLIVISIVVLGLLFSLLLVDKTQDIRNQASTASGEVLVEYAPQINPLKTSEPVEMQFKINTQGRQISGVQLVFDIVTSSTDSFLLEPVADSGLDVFFGPSIIPTTTGYQVSVALRPSGTMGTSFSNTMATPFFKVSFEPNQPGSVQLLFNEDLSKVTDSSTSEDILRNIESQIFLIE